MCRPHSETFNLCTAADTADAPIAQVLAVIAQQAEIALAEPRAGALHNLLRRVARFRVRDDAHRLTESKLDDIHFLDGSGTPGAAETGVVHDPAVAHVDAVMRISAAWSAEVRANRRLFSESRRPASGTHCLCFPSGKHCAA